MSFELLFALIGFAFVTSVTPGPNNLMLLASGVNFGLRRTFPHMMGVALGFGLMVALVGLGLARIFQLWPVANTVLQIASILYLLWLAWKIAGSAPPDAEGAEVGTPMTFLQAAAFQWVNPKAWTMALGAISLYAPSSAILDILIVAGVFTLINLPSVGIWAAIGTALSGVLRNPVWLRRFNWLMAALLVATLWPVIRALIAGA